MGGRRMPLERIEVLTTAGENVPLYLEPSKTVKDLKEAVDEKIGVDPADQKVSVLGYPLDDDDIKLEELLDMSHTFNVGLPDTSGNKGKGAKFMSDRNVFLINGKRFNFQAIQLFAKTVEKIELKSNKFGLVRHVEGEVGKRIFHLRRYAVDKETEKETRIETRTDDANEEQKVYLISNKNPNGGERELEPVKYTTYKEKMEGNKISASFKTVREFFD